ncbi:MAG: response regulator transcription factor, partial [Candidatus Korobacteraceae bacterium]
MTHPRILLADDHQAMLKTIACLLTPKFEIVGTASNGVDLISEAVRLQPDIVITDITMPGLNGIDAVHELRKMGCSAKFIFLTVHE